MALINCKECGNKVSSKAETCPQCGITIKKKPQNYGCGTLILFIFLVGIIASVYEQASNGSASSASASPPPAHRPNPRDTAIKNIKITDFEWQKGGFDTVALLNITIKNTGQINVKDIGLACAFYSKSKTVLNAKEYTIYENFPAAKTKTVKKINLGFIDPQAASMDCTVYNLVLP